jgi:hypothetical protein
MRTKRPKKDQMRTKKDQMRTKKDQMRTKKPLALAIKNLENPCL